MNRCGIISPLRRCVFAVKTEVLQSNQIAGAESIDRKETKTQRKQAGAFS